MVDSNAESSKESHSSTDTNAVGSNPKSFSIQPLVELSALAKHFSKHRLKYCESHAGEKASGLEDRETQSECYGVRHTGFKPESDIDPSAY